MIGAIMRYQVLPADVLARLFHIARLGSPEGLESVFHWFQRTSETTHT